MKMEMRNPQINSFGDAVWSFEVVMRYLVTWNLKTLSLHDFMPMFEIFYDNTQQQIQYICHVIAGGRATASHVV